MITFRRGVYLNKNLEKGTKIKEKDLVFLRPNVGLDARDYKKIIGRRLKKNTKKIREACFK